MNNKLELLGLLTFAIESIIAGNTTKACMVIAKVARIISEEDEQQASEQLSK